MEVHAAGAIPPTPLKKSSMSSGATPAPVMSAPEVLKPQDVPLMMSQSALAQGQSLADVPIVDASSTPENQNIPVPRAILPAEIKQVLDAYNGHVRSYLEHAPHGSRLEQFETCLRLMANLQDPRLQQDKQAWDTLQMRHSQIDTEYKRLIQEPEVKQAFDQSRIQALNDIFGSQLSQRTHQQADYLLDDHFQQELDKLPEAEVQPRIQQELSALAILNPRLAKTVAEELIKRTVEHQSLKALQAPDTSGTEARAGLSQALGLYLKAQQTAIGVSLQATNISRLVNLSDKQIGELTDAISELARDAQAGTPQQLALNLVNRVEELPPELRQNASSLIRHMHAQNVLGTILLAGSVAGLMQQDLPKDPKAWASLGAGALGSATMAHFAFRMVGLNQAAEVAAKLNTTASLRGMNIPVVGALVTGVNTTLDAMALVEEVHNEDTAGTISRAMGVGSGLATLAAITAMKGKAVPIALISSTVVGLTAWGIDSLWGESDTTGKIRRDLRLLGISDSEKASLDSLKRGVLPNELPLAGRVSLINALMDQATNSKEETLIFETLMRTPDDEFLPLLQQLHTPRLIAELESRSELKPLLQRIAQLAQPGQDADKLFAPLMQGLVNAQRFNEMDYLLSVAHPAFKQTLPPAAMQAMVDTLLKGWTRDSEEQAVVHLLKDIDLKPASEAMLKLGGEKLMFRLKSELPEADTGALLGQMLRSTDGDVRKLAAGLFQREPGQRVPTLTRLGPDQTAARMALEALSNLNQAQIKALPSELKASLARLFEQTHQSDWLIRSLKG